MASPSRRQGGTVRTAIFLAVYELAWLACVLSAARGRPSLGVAAVACFVAGHVVASRRRHAEIVLVVAAAGIGLAWELLLARTGWVAYASADPASAWPPLWVLALWALFATLLSEPLRWLQGRLPLAGLFGVVGAPLAYLGAEGMHACRLLAPLPAALAIGIGWGVITPLLVELARRLRPRPSGQGEDARSSGPDRRRLRS